MLYFYTMGSKVRFCDFSDDIVYIKTRRFPIGMRESNPSRLTTILLGYFCPLFLDRRQPACVARNKTISKISRREVHSSFYGADFRQDKETERRHTCVCRARLTQYWRKDARKNRLGFGSRMPNHQRKELTQH